MTMGALIGVSVLGLVGSTALGFTIIGILVSVCLGGFAGGYIGKRIKKQQLKTKNFDHFSLYSLKLESILILLQKEIINNRCDLNTLRFYLVESLKEVELL